jgi:hypothetical protein
MPLSSALHEAWLNAPAAAASDASAQNKGLQCTSAPCNAAEAVLDAVAPREACNAHNPVHCMVAMQQRQSTMPA